MDLIKLNASNQPDKLIENYDSLIWTERFNTLGSTGGVGDFQIITGNTSQFMSLLPEGTVLSLRESNVAMIVEDHQINRKKNQPEQLVITGRSFDSILDRRASVQSVDAPPVDWNVNLKTPSDVAWFIIQQICVGGVCDDADIFPAATVVFNPPTDYSTSTGPIKAFTIPRGNLFDTVMSYLQTEAKADATTSPATPAVRPHGIRAIRPNSAGTAVAIEIYTGTDKTSTVRFDATRDMLDDGTYRFSKKGSGNTGYILGQTYSGKMNESGAVISGMERRVILVDATSSGINDAATLQAYGSMSLAEAEVTASYDGSINQDLSVYQYGVDYNLGDVVTLVGDYGLTANARVTEYIRSEDATGVKRYPTLSALSADNII